MQPAFRGQNTQSRSQTGAPAGTVRSRVLATPASDLVAFREDIHGMVIAKRLGVRLWRRRVSGGAAHRIFRTSLSQTTGWEIGGPQRAAGRNRAG